MTKFLTSGTFTAQKQNIMAQPTKDKAAKTRNKHTVYTDKSPETEEMIRRAKADGRTFANFALHAITDWLYQKGYGDDRYEGKKFSGTICKPQ